MTIEHTPVRPDATPEQATRPDPRRRRRIIAIVVVGAVLVSIASNLAWTVWIAPHDDVVRVVLAWIEYALTEPFIRIESFLGGIGA